MPVPKKISLNRQKNQLSLHYERGPKHQLSAEYLRVLSPSAEVRGHGISQGTLPTGKRDVTILTLTKIGHYALRIQFNDGHDSGIYSWDYLWDLSYNVTHHWEQYLAQLRGQNKSRDSHTQILKLSDDD